MDSFDPVPPIRPTIPDIARIQPLPRVQRDEQRQPAPDDQYPPEPDDDRDEEEYEDGWQDEHLPASDGHLPASEERYAAEQYAAEEESTPTQPISDRRGAHGRAADTGDGPGPHIDISA